MNRDRITDDTDLNRLKRILDRLGHENARMIIQSEI